MTEDYGTLEYTLIESEPIIGFNLWGERRICLPQLLRFVLPDFDINVIDRAVTDLQINCFQCNSEQIRLLHVNDIVPKAIVRCGLIRKSDAERLCKYLLQPNKNTDISNDPTFTTYKSIDVIHTCFGEQRGTLYPVLYTSSDSKCIKCSTCDNFFKTFEFVGHTHKLDEVSNTFHWGFDSNNWRLLLQIFADKINMNSLNESKAILDRVKTLFYEEELKKINKFHANIVWRPGRRLKLPNLRKVPFLSAKPSHLNDGPVEFYQKNINRGLNNLRVEDIDNSNYVPNVYLDTQDNVVNSESTNDDDDIEEYEDAGEKSIKNPDEIAMNVALQIKREMMPRDSITLGTIRTFLNKKDINMNDVQSNIESTDRTTKSNYSPVVVAQAHASVPPQFLMLEALWSQLFRDIIQLTHLVQFNTNDERNRLVSQLIRCQDLFRSQWTNLAEENQSLKENLVSEQKRRQDMETIRDKMAVSLKELTVEKENLTEIVKQLELKCEPLQSEISVTSEKSMPVKCCDEDCTNEDCESGHQILFDNEMFRYGRMKFKRQLESNEQSGSEEGTSRVKHRRQDSISGEQYGSTSSSHDAPSW